MTGPVNEELIERAGSFAKSRGVQLDFQYPLGSGIDGAVWRTSRSTAVKICERVKNFRDELECYRRMTELGIRRLQEIAIPKLVDFDEPLMAIEMTIVSPPFLLDFGKVYLDAPPPYWSDAQIMGNWHAEGRENFGNRWGTVMSLVHALQKLGIYYVDPKPGNILFGDEADM